MKKLLIILVLSLFSVALFAQDKQQNSYYNFKASAFGLYGGVNFNQHFTDFPKLPGTYDCCPKYRDGSGTGFAIGGLYSMPLNDFLMFDMRLGYFTRDGQMTYDEPVILNRNGEAYNGIFEHTLDAGLGSISLEPILGIKLIAGLKFNIGLHAGFVISKTYSLKETIKDPADGTFENGLRERLVQTGDIEESQSLEFSPLAGLSYDIPLDARQVWYITPEVFYYYGLTDVLNDYKWKVNTLHAGLAVKYAPWEEGEAEEEEVEEPAKYPYLQGKIRAVGLDADSVEKPVLQFIVEEFLSTEVKPLLTYIFFDEGSSELRPVYHKLTPEQTKDFSEKKIAGNYTLDVYYDVLNIIGSRMQKYPEAQINIEGCNSNTGVEKNNMTLSENRAETVFDYLKSVWNIDDSRMRITSRNLPQEPSNPKEADGIQENQRVEITANKYEIIAPVIVDDTFRTVNPPVARFYPEVVTEAGIKSWDLVASQNNTLVNRFVGDGTLPGYVEWKFEKDQTKIPKQNGELTYYLKVEDNTGQIKQTEPQTLPVDLITVQKKKRDRVKDKYIDRYSLILFSFDKSELSYYNSTLTKFIKSRSKPNSKIFIKGHTDRMGEAAYNLTLSKQRADAVAKEFKEYDTSVSGYGEVEQMYDNNLPEGRFYCRKVDIIVETPIDNQ